MNNSEKNDSSTTSIILDSMLISATLKKLYNLKLVICGNYVQVYNYEDYKVKNKKIDKNDLNLKRKDLNLFNNESESENENKNKNLNLKSSNEIEQRNIIRSKLECQRLAKSNIEDWRTFITLTFDPKTALEPMNNIVNANKRFHIFITKVRRVKKDFKYICVPEFHKSGIVHYHLLSNIEITDPTLMYNQEDNPKFKHIKYWTDGFTCVEVIKGDPKKIIGYIAKYMTKDIDNRLFNKHRYLYSNNLLKPQESFIDLNNETEREFFIKKIQEKTLIYQNEYLNAYDNTKVNFLELY